MFAVTAAPERCQSRTGRGPHSHFFFVGALAGWPLTLCDCLYADPTPFGLSPFGFFTSLLPLAIAAPRRVLHSTTLEGASRI
jgi:hypothetical protein